MAQFSNYGDVQAALDREHQAWLRGETVGRTQEGQAARDWWANYKAPTASGGGTPPPPAPPPSPNYPNFVKRETEVNVKVAPTDQIIWDETAGDVENLMKLVFESLGATELSTITRGDLIDGQETIYDPIYNLPSLRQSFNPNNMIFAPQQFDYFTRFGINIFTKALTKPYVDEDGNLVIEMENMSDEEEVQVQILENGIIEIVEET